MHCSMLNFWLLCAKPSNSHPVVSINSVLSTLCKMDAHQRIKLSQVWASEQFLNGTSAQYRLLSGTRLKAEAEILDTRKTSTHVQFLIEVVDSEKFKFVSVEFNELQWHQLASSSFWNSCMQHQLVKLLHAIILSVDGCQNNCMQLFTYTTTALRPVPLSTPLRVVNRSCSGLSFGTFNLYINCAVYKYS